MQSLEGPCEQGELSTCLCSKTDCRSLKMVGNTSRNFKKPKRSSSSLPLNLPQDSAVPTMDICAATKKPQFCIHTKLLELYLEECAKDPNQQRTGLKQNTNLLEKLVAKERLNTIILNLYPGYKGYSIILPSGPNNESCGDGPTEPATNDRSNFSTASSTAEMKDFDMRSYDNEELLRYLDLEEIPAFLSDLLEPYHSFLFYSGCLIVQVRDYRQTFPAALCDIHHVLLKPSLQSVMADCNAMEDWTQEDRADLESKILLVNNPKLCLEVPDRPRRGTSRQAALHHNRHLLNTHRLRRAARKFSLVTMNRKKKLVPHTYRPGLELHDYLTRLRSRPRAGRLIRKLSEDVKPVPVPNLEPQYLPAPSGGVHIDKFKAYTRPPNTTDCRPQLVEEYVLETDTHAKDSEKRRAYHIKLSILQRPACGEYLGELYLDRDHKKGQHNGVTYRFSLGTQVHTNRYIQQFAEIFTEGGRNSFIPGRVYNVTESEINLAQNTATSIANGPVSENSQQQPQQASSNSSVPILAQLKYLKNTGHDVNSEVAKLLSSVHQMPTGKQQSQQQKVSPSNNHPAIINILNSSPASNINSDASAAVVNAINNTKLLPQNINPKILGRKITVTNVVPPNARVLNATNVISVNNNRTISMSDLAAAQHYTTVLNKPNQVRGDGGKKALAALLVDTPAADRTDIINPNTNPLVLEKLASAVGQNQSSTSSASFIQQSGSKYGAQATVKSPPPAASGVNTINVQSLSLAQLQNIPGMQNVQVQLAGSQHISLSYVSTPGGHPTGLYVSVPVTSTASTTSPGQCNNNNSIGSSQAVVLTNAGTSNLAQLMNSSGKRPASVLNQAGTPFQLVATQLGHRPTRQQLQMNRSAIRAPITIKRAATAPQTTNLNKQPPQYPNKF